MASTAELAIRLTADVSDADGKLQGVIGKLGGALGTSALAGGALVAAGLAAGIKSAGDLEQSVANISTIKPEIDTSGVFRSLNDMQTRVPQSAAQLGDSLYNVFSSIDVSVGDGLQLVEKFARGAVGAQTDAQTFGTAVLGVMNAYKLGVGDADRISDVFFNTVNRGVVTGPELAASLGPVTAAAKTAGVSLEELGGMIVGVTKEGGPAAQNINNLNNFLQKITTTEAQKAIRDLGVATTDSSGKFRPMVDILTDMKPRLDAMTEAGRAAYLQKIFPDAQARQGAITLLSQIDAVKAAVDENRSASGSASTAYEKMSATFNSQSTLVKNSLMSVLTTIGAAVLPAITPLISAFAKGLPEAFAQAQAAIGPVVAALRDAFKSGDFGPFLDRLGALGSQIGGKLGEIGGRIADGVAEWGAALLEWIGPRIGPLVEQLAQLSERLVGWVKEEGLPALGAALADWGTAFVAWVAPQIPPLLAELGGLLADMGGWLVGTALPEIASGLLDWGTAFVAWVAPRIGPLLGELGGLLVEVGGWLVGTALPEIIARLAEWGGEFVAWVAPRIGPLLAELGGLLVEVGGWLLGTALPAIVSNLLEWGTAFVAWVAPKIPELLAALGGLMVALDAWLLGTALPAIVAKLTEWGTAFIDWVAKDVLPRLPGALATIVTTVSGWAASAAGQFAGMLVAAGSALMEGMISGIRSMAGRLAGEAVRVVTDAIDAVKSKFGIRSPSTVFRNEVGIPIAEGIALGIETEGSDVTGAATRVVQGALVPAKTAVADVTATVTSAHGPWRAWQGDITAAGAALTATATDTAGVGGAAGRATPQVRGLSTALTDQFTLIGALGAQARGGGAFIGSELVNGIIGGIRTNTARVMAEAQALVAAIAKKAQEAAKIKSPSQLMADEVGRPLGEGVLVGMQRAMGGAGGVMRAAVAGTPGLSPAPAPPPPPAGGGGVTINVTIPGAVYGVLDLEDRIKRVVREAARGGAFRGVLAGAT